MQIQQRKRNKKSNEFYGQLKEVFQHRSIEPYIPQGHVRKSSMTQPNFISYQKTITPIRAIVSHKRTATYQLANYLAKLLSPLSQSQYTIKSTKDFTEKYVM